jgi:hypothetical protein
MFTEAGIDLVCYGPHEVLVAETMMRSADLTPPEDMAAVFRDKTRSLLRQVFSNEQVTIYRVRLPTTDHRLPTDS